VLPQDKGSDEATDCKCKRGFTGVDGGPCSACFNGTYKAEVGSGACSVCPGNASSTRASTSHSECRCVAGFVGPAGGPCTPCGLSLVDFNGNWRSLPDNSTSTVVAGALSVRASERARFNFICVMSVSVSI